MHATSMVTSILGLILSCLTSAQQLEVMGFDAPNQDEVTPDLIGAWSSLIQMHTANISQLHGVEQPQNATWLFANVTEGERVRVEQLPVLLASAMKRVAVQDFDPFDTGIDKGTDEGSLKLLVAQGKQPQGVPDDVFPSMKEKGEGMDVGMSFFESAPRADWLILAIFCVVLFLVDCFVLQRLPNTFWVHALCLVFWFFVAMAYCGIVWSRFGHKFAFDWCTGYCLEWMLSMDNLFVFHLVFETYKTPVDQTHRAVFLGIIGAVGIRLLFFMLVSTLLHYFSWIRFPFGALLIWSGIQAARGDDDDVDVNELYMVRGVKWLCGDRLTSEYDKAGRMFVRNRNGKLQMTLLALVVFCLEACDVVFALDSVSAKIAQIPQEYIAFSSTVIAMYGLRAMFFIIKDLVQMFELLQYGLCLILVFIGLELMFAHWMKLPSSAVCIMIISVFAVFTAASVAKNGLKPREELERAPEGEAVEGK